MMPAEQLRAAKALIDTPECWTKHANSRDMVGIPVDPLSASAECWCAHGALFVQFPVLGPEYRACVAALETALKGEPLAGFNDAPSTTHADIMKLFDDAIALAEAAQ